MGPEAFLVLMFTVCNLAEPSQCVPKEVRYPGDRVEMCLNTAQIPMAAYIGDHPGWGVRGPWRCEWRHDKQQT